MKKMAKQMASTVLGVLTALATGCGGAEDPEIRHAGGIGYYVSVGDENEANTPAAPEATPQTAGGSFAPEAGPYTLTSSLVIADSCSGGPTGGPPTSGNGSVGYVLTNLNAAAGTYQLEAYVPAIPFPVAVESCALSGKNFECSRADVVIDYAFLGLDAVLTLSTTTDGTFPQPDRFHDRLTQSFACAGSDCDDPSLLGPFAGSFPCESQVLRQYERIH
jgi:hypothetical protein